MNNFVSSLSWKSKAFNCNLSPIQIKEFEKSVFATVFVFYKYCLQYFVAGITNFYPYNQMYIIVIYPRFYDQLTIQLNTN